MNVLCKREIRYAENMHSRMSYAQHQTATKVDSVCDVIKQSSGYKKDKCIDSWLTEETFEIFLPKHLDEPDAFDFLLS